MYYINIINNFLTMRKIKKVLKHYILGESLKEIEKDRILSLDKNALTDRARVAMAISFFIGEN